MRRKIRENLYTAGNLEGDYLFYVKENRIRRIIPAVKSREGSHPLHGFGFIYMD